MWYILSFFFQNAVCFIILTYLVPVLFTFYIRDVLKLKKNNSGAKRIMKVRVYCHTLIGQLPSLCARMTDIELNHLCTTQLTDVFCIISALLGHHQAYTD